MGRMGRMGRIGRMGLVLPIRPIRLIRPITPIHQNLLLTPIATNRSGTSPCAPDPAEKSSYRSLPMIHAVPGYSSREDGFVVAPPSPNTLIAGEMLYCRVAASRPEF